MYYINFFVEHNIYLFIFGLMFLLLLITKYLWIGTKLIIFPDQNSLYYLY